MVNAFLLRSDGLKREDYCHITIAATTKTNSHYEMLF